MRLLRIAGVSLIVGMLSVLFAAPAAAEVRTVTFTVNNVTVPFYNVTATGVLTMTYDDVTGEGAWNYQGTIGGVPASASGSGICIVTSGSGVRGLASLAQTEVTLTMTAIDSWNMPGFAPYVPREAAVSSVGELAYVNYDGRQIDVFGVPVAFEPSLTFPVEGNYTISDPASGEQPVTTLPNTGVGSAVSAPTGFGGSLTALWLPALGGLVALAAAVGFGSRNRRLVVAHG